MSNERAMKNWPLIRTYLENSPMMKPKKLENQLRGRICRTDMFGFLKFYEQKGLIVRPSGSVMLVKKQSFWLQLFSVLKSGFGLVGYFKWRQQYNDEKRKRRKLERKCEIEALKEIITELDEDDPEIFKKEREIRRNMRREYGLA